MTASHCGPHQAAGTAHRRLHRSPTPRSRAAHTCWYTKSVFRALNQFRRPGNGPSKSRNDSERSSWLSLAKSVRRASRPAAAHVRTRNSPRMREVTRSAMGTRPAPQTHVHAHTPLPLPAHPSAAGRGRTSASASPKKRRTDEIRPLEQASKHS